MMTTLVVLGVILFCLGMYVLYVYRVKFRVFNAFACESYNATEYISYSEYVQKINSQEHEWAIIEEFPYGIISKKTGSLISFVRACFEGKSYRLKFKDFLKIYLQQSLLKDVFFPTKKN